jgi:hypothetical protein
MYFLDTSSKLGFHESIGTMMSRFSCSLAVTTAHYANPNFLNRNINLLRMQIPSYFDYPFVFVDACEDSIMANYVIMPSNPLIVLIEDEKFEKTLLDINVS